MTDVLSTVCHLELGLLQQLKLLQGLGMIHWPQIVYEFSSLHEKLKEQCLLLCIVPNMGPSKLSSPSSIHLLYFTHALCSCLQLAVMKDISIAKILFPLTSRAWSIATIKVEGWERYVQ